MYCNRKGKNSACQSFYSLRRRYSYFPLEFFDALNAGPNKLSDPESVGRLQLLEVEVLRAADTVGLGQGLAEVHGQGAEAEQRDFVLRFL